MIEDSAVNFLCVNCLVFRRSRDKHAVLQGVETWRRKSTCFRCWAICIAADLAKSASLRTYVNSTKRAFVSPHSSTECL